MIIEEYGFRDSSPGSLRFEKDNMPKPGAVVAYNNGCINLISVGDYDTLSSQSRLYQEVAPDGAVIKVIDTSYIDDINEIIKDPKSITKAFEKWFL